MEWYYAENGQQVGPITASDLEGLAHAGKVTPETLVWREGMANWDAYKNTRSSGTPPSPDNTAACVECKKVFSQSDMIQYQNSWICATCKPIFFQRIQEGAVIPGTMVYAGFWIRFGAKFIDNVILQIVGGLAGFVIGFSLTNQLGEFATQLLAGGVGYAISLAYTTYLVGKYGATLGKTGCKLKVVRPDGSPISYGRACGRFFAEILSGLILGIGYLMAAFDKEERRALHDRICDTRVVKKS